METLENLRTQGDVIDSFRLRAPICGPYRPILEVVNYTRKEGRPVMGFYSHELREGDVIRNIWFRSEQPFVIKIEKIIERRDACGEWVDGFNKNLYVRALVSFVPAGAA